MMDVRQVRPTDAPLVLALALDDTAQLVTGPGPLAPSPLWRLATQAVMPMAFSGRAWIAKDGTSAGILEAQPRPYVMGWDVVRLAVRGDHSLVVGPLLGGATAHLQSKGVPRLFARCTADLREILAAHDFLTLAQEYVLLGPSQRPPGDGGLNADSRYRMPQDAWPLHQLESETTPALVRQLEGLTSSDWSHKSRGMSEVVVEAEGRIVAWIGWGIKPHRGLVQLGLLVRPEYKHVGPRLVLHALQHAPEGSRFAIRVREYQAEAIQACLDAGFQIVGEEPLMVKHAGAEGVAEARRHL